MGDETTKTLDVKEEDIPTILWIIVYILRGESGKTDSRERSLAVTKLEEAIHWLYADQQQKADQKERERLAKADQKERERLG